MPDRVTVHMIGNAHIDPVWRGADLLPQIRAAAERVPEEWGHSIAMYGVGNHW